MELPRSSCDSDKPLTIVVLDGNTLNPGDNSWEPVEKLGNLQVYHSTEPDQVFDRARDADILLTNKTPISGKVLARLPKLKMISVLATGYNVVDVTAASKLNLPVCNVPVYGTRTVAQHVMAMLLAFIHRPHEHDRAIRNNRWQDCGEFSFWLSPLTELVDKRMGIIGLGRIGTAVAHLANAFGMKVIANTRSPQEPLPFSGFRFVSQEELFVESDVISLHCPQTDENFGFVNLEMLQRMKPTAILINASRGGLINEQDLARVLNNGEIAGALLDVVSVEPIETGNPLLTAKNCLLTPHYAWATVEARQRLMEATADNIRAFRDSKPINVVNRVVKNAL